MIGMISPLVQEAKKSSKRFLPFGLYMLGVLLSSLAVGLFLGALGSTMLPSQWLRGALLMVAVIGIGMACCDLGVAGRHTPTLYRQTCRVWWHTIGHYGAIFLWGCDLGLGWTTIRIASLYWIVCLVIVILASPWIGTMIMVWYGFALVLSLAISTFGFGGADQGVGVRVLRLARPLRKGLAVVLLLWCILIVVFGVLSGL